MAYSVTLIHGDRTLAQLTLDSIPSKSDTFVVDKVQYAVAKIRWRIVTQPRLKVQSVDVLLMSPRKRTRC